MQPLVPDLLADGGVHEGIHVQPLPLHVLGDGEPEVG